MTVSVVPDLCHPAAYWSDDQHLALRASTAEEMPAVLEAAAGYIRRDGAQPAPPASTRICGACGWHTTVMRSGDVACSRCKRYAPPGGEIQPPPPGDVLVVWAQSAESARGAAWALCVDQRRVIAIGNCDEDALRGVVPTAVLIVPGADSADVERALDTACSTVEEGVLTLDLRAVQA